MDDDVEEEQIEEQHVEIKIEEFDTTAVTEKPLAPPKYEVRPGLGEKFQAQNVREIIRNCMHEQLMGRAYRSDLSPKWVKMIANAVRYKVQELDMKRYKIIVQCMIIEMKGAGVKCAQRCIWDPETDQYTEESYRNETIFCHTTVYGIYMY